MPRKTFTHRGLPYTLSRAERGWIVEGSDGSSGRGLTIVDALEGVFGTPLRDPQLLVVAIDTVASELARAQTEAA